MNEKDNSLKPESLSSNLIEKNQEKLKKMFLEKL